jgi:hypothetical protein
MEALEGFTSAATASRIRDVLCATSTPSAAAADGLR